MIDFEKFNNSIEPTRIDTSLVKAIIEAAGNSEKWGGLLKLIVEKSNACAAIVTLRNGQTCQIINDRDLEQDYHSPLIFGFSDEAVGYYMTTLRTSDPWAEAQRQQYPFHPRLMSTIRHPEAEPNNQFFRWLFEHKMQDSVVFELDRMAGYWTACNLFLPTLDKDEGQELLDFTNAHFQLLRSAWKSSQNHEQTKQTLSVLMDQINNMGSPCALVGPNGELLENNDKFSAVLDADIARISRQGKRISFSDSLILTGLIEWETSSITRYAGPDNAGLVHARSIEPDPRFEGKRERYWFLEFVAKDNSSSKSHDISVLTKQELQLYNAIVDGATIVEAGKKIGVRRTRTHVIWGCIREKLQIRDAHELRK